MSSFSNYIKARKEKDKDFFFGEGNWRNLTNKYIAYKSVINDDEIIIRTSNVKYFKGNPVLVVGSNDVVYLKDWQVKDAHAWEPDFKDDFYIVKLNRKYFKKYHFQNPVLGFEGAEDRDFDNLLTIAKEQEESKMLIALGHMKI